jgi:hypothetical protein
MMRSRPGRLVGAAKGYSIDVHRLVDVRLGGDELNFKAGR